MDGVQAGPQNSNLGLVIEMHKVRKLIVLGRVRPTEILCPFMPTAQQYVSPFSATFRQARRRAGCLQMLSCQPWQD